MGRQHLEMSQKEDERCTVSHQDNHLENDPNCRKNASDEKDEEMDSSDEALCELLGLTSLNNVVDETDSDETPVRLFDRFYQELQQREEKQSSSEPHRIPENQLHSLIKLYHPFHEYQQHSMCILPSELSISAEILRRWTEEVVWSSSGACSNNSTGLSNQPYFHADRTFETIKVWNPRRGTLTDEGAIEERRTLTRLENFVNTHPGWYSLCNGYLRQCISAIMGVEMILFKEKLNLKPPGGSGFAPHLDSPSLRIALSSLPKITSTTPSTDTRSGEIKSNGPQTFVTVMVAIDDMTSQNGCLRICRGPWSESNHIKVIKPEENGNPDGSGRGGAIPASVLEDQSLQFEDIVCKGGTIVAFNGWVPHRSSPNKSHTPRRAVFLTYNPKSEGDFHDMYYAKMEKLRNTWRESIGFNHRQQEQQDLQSELEALSTVPKI